MGGGGFNCHQALQCIRKRDLSVALFAPGWVFERLEKAEFERNQFQFWSLMAPGLPCKRIEHIPFSTTFAPGKRWFPPSLDDQGSIIERCFLSLRDQEVQPHWFCPRDSDWPSSNDCTEHLVIPVSHFQDDYNPEYPGGAALKVTVKGRNNRIRLFCCHLPLDQPVHASVTIRRPSDVHVGLAFSCRCEDQQPSVYMFPNSLDEERTCDIISNDFKCYSLGTAQTVRNGLEEISGFLPANKEILTAIDLLIMTPSDAAVDCLVYSFSLSHAHY